MKFTRLLACQPWGVSSEICNRRSRKYAPGAPIRAGKITPRAPGLTHARILTRRRRPILTRSCQRVRRFPRIARMGRRAKPACERIAEITAARDELRDIFTEAGLPPVFPRLHGEVYPPRGGALSCTGIVSRVRAAINQCEHAPEYTVDSTIKQKVLAALAKDGRQDNAAAFETFDAYQFVMATAAEPVDEASQQPQPVTAAAPVADAPPSISAFRAAGKSESAAQAEYRCAMHGFHDARRSVERAAEARKRRALEASLAQTNRRQGARRSGRAREPQGPRRRRPRRRGRGARRAARPARRADVRLAGRGRRGPAGTLAT